MGLTQWTQLSGNTRRRSCKRKKKRKEAKNKRGRKQVIYDPRVAGAPLAFDAFALSQRGAGRWRLPAAHAGGALGVQRERDPVRHA